mmetsp:Transcript_2733/g.3453  ORF Transcript_2733/g.3453 Transcript_2733/m.3453 type:complete len:100 (+) Transcript_2733:930-1229(+)
MGDHERRLPPNIEWSQTFRKRQSPEKTHALLRVNLEFDTISRLDSTLVNVKCNACDSCFHHTYPECLGSIRSDCASIFSLVLKFEKHLLFPPFTCLERK